METSQSTQIDSLESLGSQHKNAEEDLVLLLHLLPSALSPFLSTYANLKPLH